MNVKEYLNINSSPLLDDPQNILLLEWLEANAFCTPAEISKYTKISLNKVNDILHILYKNSLVSFRGEKYKITFKGIKILDKLGLSDLQIQNLLSKTNFINDEYFLYKALFKTWRSNFLDFYLIIYNILDQKWNDVLELYSNSPSLTKISEKDTYTIFVATLMHDFGSILYADETSRLMTYYTKLYDYSLQNYCFSSEIYHNTSIHWQSNNIKSNFSKLISGYLKTASKPRCVSRCQPTSDMQMFNWYDVTTLNYDLGLSHKILSNDAFLNSIFDSENFDDLCSNLQLTPAQTKFLLKSIRSKIENLMPTKNNLVNSHQNFNQ